MGIFLRVHSPSVAGVPPITEEEQLKPAVPLLCRQHCSECHTAGGCRLHTQFQTNSDSQQLHHLNHCLFTVDTHAPAHNVLLAKVKIDVEGQ